MEGFKGMVGSLITRAADGCNVRIEMTIPTARFDPIIGEMVAKIKQFEGQAGCKVEITYEITGHVHLIVHTEKVVANTPWTPVPPLSVGVSRNDSNFNGQYSTNFWNAHAQKADAGITWTNHAGQYYPNYSLNSQSSYASLQNYSNFHTNLSACSPQMARSYGSMEHHEHATLNQAQMVQNAALSGAAASVFPSHAAITAQRTSSEAYAPTSPGSPDRLRYSAYSHPQTRVFSEQDNFSHSNYNG
ncbi:unnamed protein product [Angiostrongylus costaricensis]|uniref:KH_dom_type_1 domain-containing protein n=1 Tax=Angiostrongylus costaricensis TaxID=334426 RepID=A0A0R3PRA6_ANGCS|nr:unnamed protein product [Angiostrongylus costaricensis]